VSGCEVLAQPQLSAYTPFMPCPTCGGAAREPISIGYWRCASEVADQTQKWVPDNPAVSFGSMHPVMSVTYRECGTNYQEATGAMTAEIPRCACGLFAVGGCAECGEYTCGMHGSSPMGRFLCSTHAQAAVRKEEELRRADDARKTTSAVPPAPIPRTLRDHVTTLDRAAQAQSSAAVGMASTRSKKAQDWADEVHADLVSVIAEVLALPAASSVEYAVIGERRGMKWGLNRVADPYRLGSHVANAVGGGRAGYYPWSTYDGVWPALVWLTGWEEPRDGSPLPLLGSLWFNKQGIVVGGPPVRGAGYTRPAVSYYCSEGRPSGGAARTGHPTPGIGDLGPLHINDLRPENLVPICRNALTRPKVLTASLARIVRGEQPELEY
jgi:hypothetical protein